MKKYLLMAMLCVLSVLFVHQALAAKRTSHKDFADMPLKECNDCHKDQGIALTHDNDWAGRHHQDNDWMGEHRALALKAGKNCADCHDQSFCIQCHTGGGVDVELRAMNSKHDYIPKSHRSNWLDIHQIKTLDNPQTCTRCHLQKYCNDCHSRFRKGDLKIKSHKMLGPNGQKYSPAINEHATEARRNIQSCQTCHPEGDVCIQCHASGKTNPHPRNWSSIKNNFRNKAGNRVCTKCHLPGTY